MALTIQNSQYLRGLFSMCVLFRWDREILVTDSDSGNTDFIWLPKEKLLFAQVWT